MHLNEPQRSEDTMKEVRVKIPVPYHVRLHTMKVLSGKLISTTVTEALEDYFQRLAKSDAAPVSRSAEGSA